MSETTDFGTPRREGHDASAFYGRRMYIDPRQLHLPGTPALEGYTKPAVPICDLPDWRDRVYCHTAENMAEIPDASVGLSFTSPPYNAGKSYDDDLTLGEYLTLIGAVSSEVYRVLVPGGRFVVNVAGLGRRPYIPLQSYIYRLFECIGFMPLGEIVWQKGAGANGNCAWGSWKSAKSPVLRDLHEYLLVFTKGRFGRADTGESDMTGEQFMESTLSVWNVAPESARKIGHPAPFPVALAERVIRLYSFVGDVVLDPFNGSGTTCVAAAKLGRRWVGYDTNPDYCQIADRRIAKVSEEHGKNE